jgi:hypothetical protein
MEESLSILRGDRIMKSSIVRNVLLVPAMAMVLFIAGCDKGPSGVYKAEGPIPLTVDFKSGKATFSLAGEKAVESPYTVDGDKIKIDKDPDGNPITLTMNSDGSITGPHDIKFIKK